MLIQEEYTVTLDNGKSYGSGDSGLYEPFTDNVKRLFNAMQREYGPCRSSIYVDTPTGTQKVGWYFEKRKRFDDCNECAQFGTWVTFHDAEPTVTRTPHYHAL